MTVFLNRAFAIISIYLIVMKTIQRIVISISFLFSYSFYLLISIVHDLTGHPVQFLRMFLNNRTYFMTNPSGGNQYREYHQYILYRFVAQQIPQESEQDIRDVYTYSVESSAEIFF